MFSQGGAIAQGWLGFCSRLVIQMRKVGKNVTNLERTNGILQHSRPYSMRKVGRTKASLEQKYDQPCAKELPALNKSMTNLAQKNYQP